MKDFLEKYHKKNFMSNVFVILWALVMAFWINFFLLEWNDFGRNLKTSVLDIKNIEKKADLILEESNWKVILKNTKNIENMTSFSVSLSYNPEDIIVSDIKSKIWELSVLWDKSYWMVNIIVSSSSTNIKANHDILEITVEKKAENKVWLNLVNGNFTDKTGEKFELTSSGIIF